MNRIAPLSLAALSAFLLCSCAARKPAAQVMQTAPFQSHGHAVIYSLVSRTQTLTVTKGPNGPLYGISDSNGKIVLAPSTLDQVAQQDPGLYRWINSAMAAT